MTDFNVSYVFQALDHFSPTSRKISASILKINKGIWRLDKDLKKFNHSAKKDLLATAKAFNTASAAIRGTVAASSDLTRASSDVDRYTASMHRTKSVVDATNRSMLAQQAILSRSAGMRGMGGMGGGVPYRTAPAYGYQRMPSMLMPAMLGGIAGAAGAGAVPDKTPAGDKTPAKGRGGARFTASKVGRFLPFAGPAFAYVVTASTIRQGMNFERNLANMSAITGVVGDDLERLGIESKELAFKYATSPGEVVAAQKRILSGMDPVLKNPKLLLGPVTDASLLLMRASGGELGTEQAAMALVRALNAFQDSPLLALEYADILASGAKWGPAELPAVANTMGRGAWGFDLAGWSFFDLAVATQGVGKKFQNEMAGTGLAMVGQRISLRSGLQTDKLGFLGTIKVLKAVYDQQKTTAQRSDFLKQMAGLHHGKMLMELMGNIGFMEELNIKMRKPGVAQEQADINMDTYDYNVAKLSTAIREKQIALFDDSSSSLNLFVKDLTNKIHTADLTYPGMVASGLVTGVHTIVNTITGAYDYAMYPFELGAAYGEKVGDYYRGDKSWSEIPDASDRIPSPPTLSEMYSFLGSSEESSETKITITVLDPTSQVDSVNIDDEDNNGPKIGIILDQGGR